MPRRTPAGGTQVTATPSAPDAPDSRGYPDNGVVNPTELLVALRAVRNGDFSVRLPLDRTGVAGEIADVFNEIVDLNQRMSQELDRINEAVGSEGQLHQRVAIGPVSGAWAASIDSINTLIASLTQPMAEVSRVLGAVAQGDLAQRVSTDLDGRQLKGEFLRLSQVVNTMVDQLNAFASEVTRVAREVGSEGKLGGQAEVKGVAGVWKDLTDSVNSMAGNLTEQVRNIAEVTTAVANGDLSKKITVDVRGEILELKNTINTMVDQLNAFASEVTRVAREVGSEGKLGGQAEVKGVAGTWKDLTDSVNSMAGNLTSQVRNIADVTTAVANGDLSKKITVDVRGEILELKNTINTMVDQLNAFASEVTRVAREVGSEGKLGGQADVRGVAGTWKDLTDSVNSMAGNLTSQVRNIAEVTTAVANGDLSKKITVDVQGEILELKNTINTMVDQLNAFASEVTRVAREVGSEGKLGGQAQVPGVAGTWKDLTDSVNSMAGNLTSQVRNIADVTTAVANGDLSKKITVDVQGEILELKNTINTMVDQLNAFASEVTRVAREVGSEGKLGGQADVRGVAGTWKDLTDSVNSMAGNLTSQVRNIAEVTTAVANGDLSKKITVDVRGEILELKNTINTMVDQLNAFASEVTRVAREVGSEGKLGGQAEVKGVAGTWKDLTDSVNTMAGNLTSQVRNIADVTTAVANGDLSKKITVDVRGEILELKNTINTMVDQLNAFASEVTRVAREVGSEGKLGGQAEVKGVAGTWKDLTDSVNSMAGNLTSQVRNIADVTTAVANGDLSKKITVDVRGEILELKNTINTMVDQLNAFASEVTRVAREVGSEGKLGGQAQVKGVAGVWKDLTDSVNSMAGNLTEQVRNIARVVTAVANGDLKRKLTLEAKGEIAELAETINEMIDTLATFADQVTSVAREVGVEGRLGGQAEVPGAAGIWKDLTDNVNELAANLTTQVRAIGEVAIAVTKGDLSRSIQVEAQGELELLKDTVNEMIVNLRETTQKNTEQDWLKTNLARFTGMLQGQKDLQTVAKLILSELAPLVNAQHGVFYVNASSNGHADLELLSTYAYRERKNLAKRFREGEGLVGQAAYEKERILLVGAPSDYIRISSGLGEAPPLNIVVLPVLFEQDVMAVIELASFNRFSEVHLSFLDQLTESIGIVLNTIAANARTEDLLKQSQALTSELQKQQEELQQTNEELEEKARQLSEQNEEVQRRTREIEEARTELEQKAEQLALTSQYKSQFVANMSHEVRTPLNSLLILSKQLVDNAEQNLTARQIEYADTIHSAGTDLLTLINDILDLSKIESGTTTIEPVDISFVDLQDSMDRTFRPMAEGKGLEFTIRLDRTLPHSMFSDSTRLRQVLKNLLSNAVKFTDSGSVDMRIALASSGWSQNNESLNRSRGVVAFTVSDTGIGIPVDKQAVIFESFQQGEMGTARRFGGTGLGLSICREVARLLGGEIHVWSKPNQGSVFTFYLPLVYQEPQFVGTSLTGHYGGLLTGTSTSSGGDDRLDPSPPGTRPGDLVSGSRGTPTHGIRPPIAPPVVVDTSPLGELPVELPLIEVETRAAGGVQAPTQIGEMDGPPTSSSPYLDENPETSVRQPTRLPTTGAIADDRHAIEPDDKVLLIIEDNAHFAGILLDTAHESGFKGVVATQGAEGLAFARQLRPDAITLDIRIPDLDGWKILDALKHDPTTRHIPVHVVSVVEHRHRGLKQGAIEHLTKPVSKDKLSSALSRLIDLTTRNVKDLLVVEDDKTQRDEIIRLIDHQDVKITAVATGGEALEALNEHRFDCAVVDLGLPDMSGFDLIQRMTEVRPDAPVPVVVYTAKDLTKREQTRLRKLARSIVVKDATSPERLLDETSLFLHRVESQLPEAKQNMLREARRRDSELKGKLALIVDDDMRNVFALSSVLEEQGMRTVFAENGKDAIQMLLSNPEIDVVLMDIMMPDMDGYETMRRIRLLPQFQSLPIIAVTAKAMKEDRDRSLEAGATDYLSKPVDIPQLLSLLRVWLYKEA